MKNIIQNFWAASIQRQLILGVMLVHTVLMTIFVFDLVSSQRKFLHSQGISQAHSLAETLAANSASWILANDIIGMEEVIQSQSRYPDLRYAMVLSPDGRILAHTDTSKVGLYLVDKTIKSLHNNEGERHIHIESPKLIDVGSPIFSNDQFIGWARVGLGQEKIAAGLNVITRNGILYTIFAIVVGMIFAIFMAKSITLSLKHIVDVADGVKKGNLQLRSSLNRKDELGNLSDDFNLMLDTINENREKITASQHLMQSLMDDLKSMVGIMQPDGRIEFINNIPAEWLKEGEEANKNSIIGHYLWESTWLNFNEYEESIKAHCKLTAQGETVVIDTLFKNGCHLDCSRCDAVCIELTIYPVFDDDGEVIQMIFEGADVSQRKKAEALQKNYQRELEQQVSERTAELEHKATELERATKLKSEFLANMSHELRTPMNSIIGFTNRLIKKAAGSLDERQIKNLHTVERNAHHLLSLINGLLDLSKIEAGKMEIHNEIANLSTIASEVYNLTEPMLGDKPVELILNIPTGMLPLYTDKIKLKQILINLVSNAIKFTKTGTVTIVAEQIESQSAEVPKTVISIIDTGVGMSEEALQYIFEAFRQVDGSLTRQTGGTGLGLAIVSSFTELLGGKITVESEKNTGTTFKLYLPANLPKENIESSNLQNEPFIFPHINNDGKDIVLCIDDDNDVLELLSEYLMDENYQVITANTPEQGLKVAKQIKPFAITLDILMPQKDGWSVLNELKADKETCNIPVIIVSFLENGSIGYQLGAYDYMQKPINQERLIGSLERLSQDSVNTVLVVDDDAEARELMKQILDDANIDCKLAVDGKDALSVLERSGNELPELILLDLMMPGMDGFEMLQKMQENPDWMNLPVIIVTAKTLEEHERDFLQPRVASILAKEGLTAETVLKKVGKAMKRFSDIAS